MDENTNNNIGNNYYCQYYSYRKNADTKTKQLIINNTKIRRKMKIIIIGIMMLTVTCPPQMIISEFVFALDGVSLSRVRVWRGLGNRPVLQCSSSPALRGISCVGIYHILVLIMFGS